MDINKVSKSIASQLPDFIGSEYPLFAKIIEYYYQSQEKTGLGQNILNDFLQYLDIDKLNIDILDGSTVVVEPVGSEDTTIVVESVNSFLDKNGSVLIGDEVIYYEEVSNSPNIAFGPGISYDQVKLKWTNLASPINLFDGSRVTFPLTSQDSPISPPSPQHLIVSVFGEVLYPGIDYTISGTNIVFTNAPRQRIPSDDDIGTYITFLGGFVENSIVSIDNISGSFGEGKTEFAITRDGDKYEPVADEYVIAVYDNRLLTPKVDFFIDKNTFILDTAPLNGRYLSIYSIEAPVPSFGSGAVGFARVNDNGELSNVSINANGSEYRYEYPPKITVSSETGGGGSVSALVNGVKSFTLLDGGQGYSSTNPPIVQIESPTKPDSVAAVLKAVVTDGSVTALEIENSGSGYTFVPRVTFKQPGGAKLGTPTIVEGRITGAPEILDTGFGYSTPPLVYIDEPTGVNGIRAAITTTISEGGVVGLQILNPGQGYETVPRIAVIDPVGAQVLSTSVDGDGRVVNIDLLSGGTGYEDVPSVYIVDNRTDNQGNYIGGVGAKATASIFNGRITDINITDFGYGYSADNPPTVVIQSPPQARASVEIGLGEVTGFKINKSGSEYSKAAFKNCTRSASGLVKYTEEGNAVFSNNTQASSYSANTEIKCLDALFVKRMLDKYIEQFLPDVPELDYKKIDVRTSIKTIKDFYSSKGTSFSISYLFKLLYGEVVSISYPKDQIIKPSAATWSIDTILRATLVSGDPENIKDALLIQEEDIADPNVKVASALVENFISIKTSNVEIFELVLSEETINGTFVVPYKTKLAEPLGTDTSIITVDSTVGWPERNGEFLIGDSELVRYKEKSLNQFIECTRSINGIVEDWDSATEVSSNFRVYLNKDTPQEVVMNIVGIVDAQQTNLTDNGSYYLPGDKLTIAKLGGTDNSSELKTWLYNVKKLIEVESITFGGLNDQSATVTCNNPHGLLVGDQVTVYGANPILYNGTFLVTSRDSETVFQYRLPQPALVEPQGNILVSIDLNKGKSENQAVLNAIGPYTTNVQNSFFNDNYVYVASTGLPNYNIGPFPGSALVPGNQRKLNRFPRVPVTISTKNTIKPGPIGTWINGVSIWSYKSRFTKTFGAITSINILNSGEDYDAAFPPTLTISGGGGTGAEATVTVDGSISEISVDEGGSGYTTSPLVSIVGGGGSGASATAIITKGSVSRILINSGGTGYTSQPQITIVGGGGQGASATASVRGPIKSVSITNGGNSYTTNPSVTLSSGSGAVAQPIVNEGRIISIAIISAGQGYTTAPEVTIQGDGFGAIARATIDTDGENAGRVTGIEIINRGIGYTQGQTVINLNSVGQGAVFESEVFEWTYNLQSTSVFDGAQGSVFEGYNNQYGGEYAHLSNPQTLRYILGDNLFEDTQGNILEQEDQIEHSPIIGWAFDGNPIYGPYGYQDPTNQSSEVVRLNTSYRLKTNLVYNEITNPYPVRISGPLLTSDAAGTFVDDYEYVFNLGDLDQYNGRFCKTPEYPNGRYCYFVTIDATENGNPVFPYVLGPDFNSVVDNWNLSTSAVQQNIPTGVVRYRDPYENVDIDVERTPNASTNALSTEDGDILLFEIEDENRDGIISQDEIDDPDQIFEESPLQLFDYFPKVRFDSKVDIEVETTTKFEDASVTGFSIENPGQNYQVDDRLVFDNTDTDGTGVSARISRIKGETITNYTFENVAGNNFGVLTTEQPHNLQPGDTIFVDYTPVMDNTNKKFVVRQLKGIEEIIIDQTGSGYNSDIPPVLTIDGDGDSGQLSAVVTSVGSIDTVNIENSGSGYTSNPRVLLTHPQIFKKADYYTTLIENNEYVKVNDVFVNESKESFICGKTLDDVGNTVAFVAKLSATGVKEWEKTVELSSGLYYAEFQKIYVDGNDIWIAGINKPNSALLANYNPDVILVKYIQDDNGLDASIDFQKGYAGISGSTRSDNITVLKKYSDTRFVIGGYTNTNSLNPYDGFVALVDTTGNFAIKRKIASTKSEKVTDLVIDGTSIYFIMETASSVSNEDIGVSFGKLSVGTNAIVVEWIKEFTNTLYSFINTSVTVDEYDEYYICSTLRLKSDDETKDSFWVGKLNTSGNLLWNYRYVAPGRDIELVEKCTIDIFGDLNIAFTRSNNTNQLKTVDTVKLNYKGEILNHTTNQFNKNRIEGISAYGLDSDNSGDVYVFGQTSWNRNEFIFEFDETDDATDTTGNYTPTLIGNDATDALTLIGDGVAKLMGEDIGNPGTWENAAIKFAAADVETRLGDNWTLEFMLYKDSANSQTQSQTQQTLVAIGDATDSTGGLWLYYDMTSGSLELVVTNNTTAINSAGSGLTSVQTTMFADNTWQFVGLKKDGDAFTAYVNGIQIFTGTVSNTSLGNKDLYIGNIPGKDGTPATFSATYQGQYYLDNLRLRNRAVTPTVPSDVTAVPPTDSFALAYDWTDDDWFTTNLNRYDYIDYVGFGLKVDKNADSDRIGDQGEQTNSGIGLVRTSISAVTGSALTVPATDFTLSEEGFQSLDFDDATTTMTLETESLTYTNDIWGSRTATVPSPGGQKLKVTAVVKDRYYFKVTDTVKIDNIQELTINQPFVFTVGSKLVLNNDSDTFVNSGYIVKVDNPNNKVYLAINNNSWTNDLDTGKLFTEQFSEQSTYGVVGPIPNDVNQIVGYTFSQVVNTTPGTFDIDLADYDAPTGGTANLDEFATFKPYSDDLYSIRIDEVSGSSPYIVGSVITLNSGDFSYNAAYSTVQITGLTGVLKITLVTTLEKILQVTAVSNSDEVYVITSTSHYLSENEMIYVDGNPSREVGSVVYDEYDGSFPVNSIVSPIEFTYKLPSVALTDPATSAGNVSIYIKSPVLKMYYGHQYLFDMSHSSLLGSNLSFSKDNLYKLEYSFNSIERIGTPGVTGQGQPTPTIKLKVDRDIVTNISYYFDPSRPGADSPVISDSYLDVVDSPYKGIFTITGISGQTITRGADTIKFALVNEPEGDAAVNQASYSTSSKKAVGSIAQIRIVNPGGFYTRLPIVESIESTRNIERVQINEPGTEYAVGTYNGVPIQGDGEGGLVQITVADGEDEEGITIPGQIQSVVVTSPGKGYTTASIDVESIDGILGAGLTGSGAELEVVIPPFGTGASIFTKGENVGKIKKLKNNNFGYDYPHDYTLRPEITFPINAQLVSTSILDSITVTDPGSGYSQAPSVVITGGGGTGAIAEALIKNGRIDQIIVKDSGSGYSSTPTVELKSSFNYVVNVDLGLLQFAFPHGIPNGSEVTLNVVDTGDGAEFPLSAGALGRLNGNTTYYAITGAANSLEDDQLKLAITASNAELGDAISFVNSGTGRQQILTSSFGAAAEANVITSTFLEGELVYQGESLDVATATGYVSTNSGWQVGPRILKIVDYTGDFSVGQSVTGVISKSSGVIDDLKIAKGVLEIGSITKTTGQFIDDIGKPSEIIQKIQDSYYYQDFSYAIKSAVSISEWKDILINNVHPASFKVFGELSLSDYGSIPNKETDFQLTKSVELAREAIVPNIQNFALVEPIYSEFNNTEVLFRQKRLTSSENILTSVVQRLDDISNLFDGVRTSFPITVDGDNVVANANQLMIVLNGVVQNPETSFEILGDSIVFSEPPQPPASVKYINATIEVIDTVETTYTNISGIFPNIGNDLVGISSGARLRVTSVVGDTIFGFIVEGTFITNESVTVSATGFSANIATVTNVVNPGLFVFGEQITNFDGDTAKVEQINLERGQETPIAKLRYGIGPSTTTVDVISATSTTDNSEVVPDGTFEIGENYQFGSEIVNVTNVTNYSNYTTLTVTRAQLGTAATSHQQEIPVYGTQIEITNELTLSKTAGTYQSTPGLFDIQLNEVIIASQSGVVARVTSTSTYQDPVTQEFIGQVNISEGSSFFGLLFNRITSTTYPNIVLDDISKSQISVVDFTDNTTNFNLDFPSNELVNNYIIPYDNATGTFEEDEFIRNFQINYGNEEGTFTLGETLNVRKVTFTDKMGSGFFQEGQVIRTRDTKAEVIGYNQARSTIYLGKIGRTQATGEDYHTATFNNSAQLDTAQKKYGVSSLLLDDATTDYLSIPTSTEFGFGTGDFTLECWIRPDDVSAGDRHIFGMRDSGGDVNAGRLYIATNQVRFNIAGSDVVTSGATTLSADTWYHVAVSRSGTDLKMFVDGSEVGSTTNSTDLGSTKRLFIGSNFAGSNTFSGHIDEVRVSTSARYTAAFVPRNGIYQGDSDTKLLLHFDGADTQTYTEDWSGSEGFTNGEQFHNDAILATTNANSADVPGGFDGKSQRYYDAADLITANKDFIAKETVYLLTQQYPSLVIPGGNVNCEDDIRDVLTELVEDLRNGSNSHMWDASTFYVDRSVNPVTLNHVETEITETIWAYNKVDEILQYIINNTLWNVQGDHGLTQVTDTTITDSSYTTLTTLTPTDATYDPATGDFVITVASHGLTTNDIISLAPGSFRFTCDSDGNDRELAHPRVSDTFAYNRVLGISAVTTNTFTVNVGASPDDAQFAHTFVDVDADAVTVLDYSTGDCADVYTTINNLIDILTDTLSEANSPSATPDGDHLATVTRVTPAYEFIGGTVDAYIEVPFNVDYLDSGNDILYTNQIDLDSRNRYYDAANLLRDNIGPIVDKASYDLIDRYPDLALEMPRNQDGSGDGTLRCKTDLTLILNELIKDIENGGNLNTVQAAKFYLGANDRLIYIRLQVWQSVYAHNRLGHYMKQAITGDLTYDNTDDIIVGDWGITDDPGGCQNVKDSIDTLINTLNDIIAPTDNDFNIAADRLYFNRNYISDEIVGLLDDEFTYTLGSVDYTAATYTDSVLQERLQNIILSLISDLQTGGNNSVLEATEEYLTATLQITEIDDEILWTLFAIEQIKVLGEKAVRNALYNFGYPAAGIQYAAQHTPEEAYRDSESPTDIDSVVYRIRDLIDSVIETLAPGGDEARNASKNILFNENYYKTEIETLVENQFGVDSWVYDDFVDEVVNDIVHDLIITDVSDTSTASNITIESVTGNYVAGETVTSNGGGTATVLEYNELDSILVVGPVDGTAFVVDDTLTGDNGATATISLDGVGAYYTWYNNPANIKTLATARNTTSPVSGQAVGLNLWTNPEEFLTNWTTNLTDWSSNVADAPDGTRTADKGTVDLSYGSHYFYRDYSLTAYTTFDNNISKFDSGVLTFDEGSSSVAEQQQFTSSFFVKAKQYSRLRVYAQLDPGLTTAESFFDIDLENGTVGTLFTNGTGFTTDDFGIVPFGEGWFRVFITGSFSYGFSSFRTLVYIKDNFGNINFTGSRNDTKITANIAGSTSDYFGWSVATGSGKVVVGAPYDDNATTDSGCAYIYDADGTNEIRIIANDPDYQAYFGSSVAVGNNKVAVGAYNDTETQYRQGSVYLFDLDGSNQIKVNAPDGSSYDNFGRSVAIANNRLYVGTPYGDAAFNGIGSVYIFELDGTYVTEINASDYGGGDGYGWSVAAGEGKLVVGSPFNDDGTTNTGSIYIYDADGTNEVKVNASDAVAYDNFGRTLAIGDSKIVVGAQYKDDDGNSSGAVYVYDLDGTNEVKITASNAVAYDQFGFSVGISDNKVIVGAPYAEESYLGNAGVVYTYDLDGTNETIYTAEDQYYSDYFGYSVAGYDGNLYIGAPYDDDRGGNSGAVYIIDGGGGPGMYFWGAKLTTSALDPYRAVSEEVFYSSNEFNIKTYTLNLLQEYMSRSIAGSLTSPGEAASFLSYFDSVAATEYNTKTITGAIRSNIDILRQQLLTGTHYINITSTNGISLTTKTYGERDIPVGISGGLSPADYAYGLQSDALAEIESIVRNEGQIVKVYKRFRIDGDIVDGPFVMNESIEKQGDAGVTGTVYAFFEDQNFKYLDVEVTAGTWAITDTIVGDTNGTTAEISAIEDRIQIIDLIGSFEEDIAFRGYTSTATATPTDFLNNSAAITSNAGGSLTVDTETLLGEFEKTSVIYAESSRQYIEVSKFDGLDISIGNKIASDGYIRLGISVINNLDNFTEGNYIYKVSGGSKDTNNYGVITEVDLDNNFVYVSMISGSFELNDNVGDYGLSEVFPIGYASVSTKVTTAGAAAATIQDIRDAGLNKRLYLSNIKGTFDDKDAIIGPNDYRASIIEIKDIKGRVKRSSKGFDGVTTTFDLTIDDGVDYLPDPAGHILVFINGILQPPGATNAYTAFSNQIQFTEAPEIGASFTGFYVGKLRQLDDISFEFDSLRQSFNLKRNEVFYSLTLTEGVQSSTIRPENNIIVSLNGVIQEPGVGFEIVGSRIIFSEIPRVGSTFVAFSYVGSEADVDAAEVVPPIEPGDFIEIQGETEDREVAVIESSNSLITFDYLGSVFGRDARATANLTSGFIDNVQVTAGGSGYTSRPSVRIDSISGFEGNIKALVGVAGVELSSAGSGYKNPDIEVETIVPDDWTAPNLADYGEELIDPEVVID